MEKARNPIQSAFDPSHKKVIVTGLYQKQVFGWMCDLQANVCRL